MAETAQLFYVQTGDEVAFRVFEDAYESGEDWQDALLQNNRMHFWAKLIYRHEWLQPSGSLGEN